MNVSLTTPVEIALRALDEHDRRGVSTWLEQLKNWESDPCVRERAQKLASSDNVYVLKASSEFRIFFRLEKDRIVVLDIATKSTIMSFGQV